MVNNHEPMNPDFKLFYPIPYVKDLFITAPKDTVFNFEALDVIPENEYLALDAESRLKRVFEVIQKLEKQLGIKIHYNIISE